MDHQLTLESDCQQISRSEGWGPRQVNPALQRTAMEDRARPEINCAVDAKYTQIDLMAGVVSNAELCRALNIFPADAAQHMLFCEGLSINFLFVMGITCIMVRLSAPSTGLSPVSLNESFNK
jgi:hypothetical protein